MALNVISLTDMIRSIPNEEDINKLLFSFVTIKKQDSCGADDVEHFLHSKALQFEKMDLARTYLVLSTYKGKQILVGYFSISNKPLTISKKQFCKLSVSLQKKLMGFGNKTEQSAYVVKSYLLGQLGKNFSEESRKANCCSGSDLLYIAYKKIRDAYKILGGRILYLECENNDKVIRFYQSHGFSLIEGFVTENGYCMMLKQLKDILP